MAEPPLVMVVNNDAALREALQFALQLDGTAVHLHEDGAGLLADPDLPSMACLILQNHLRGIEGLEVLARLRAQGVTAPAILLTGAASPALRRRAAAAGVLLVLEKPILDDALVDAVAAVLRPAQLRDFT